MLHVKHFILVFMAPRPSIFTARKFTAMPMNLTPTARMIVLALWLKENIQGGATRSEILKMTGVRGRSFERAWALLKSRGILIKLGA